MADALPDAKCEGLLRGHTDVVLALCTHPTLPLLVSGSRDHTVRVWDLESRSLLRTLTGHRNAVERLALDPSGTRLASGSIDRTIRLWDLGSGECIRTHDMKGIGTLGDVYGMAWEATGRYLASVSDETYIRLWDGDSGELRETLAGHLDEVKVLVAHPEKDLFASGSDDRTVRVWRFTTGALLHTLVGHTKEVRSLAASNAWLVSGSWDRSLRVWSWETGRCARVIEQFAGSPRSLAWRDSRMVVLDVENHGASVTPRVWNTGSSDPEDPEDPEAFSYVTSLKQTAFTHSVALERGRVVVPVIDWGRRGCTYAAVVWRV